MTKHVDATITFEVEVKELEGGKIESTKTTN